MFTAVNTQRCFSAGIDIDQSYREMLLDIRVGGPVCGRLITAILTDFHQTNVKRSGGHRGTSVLTNKSRGERLTRRQTEVLTQAMLGRNARQGSEALGMSQETFKHHCVNLRLRLDARNMAHAVAKGVRLGIIEVPDQSGMRELRTLGKPSRPKSDRLRRPSLSTLRTGS